MRFRREVSNLIDYYEDKDLSIATKEIEDAINEMQIDENIKEKIYSKNIMKLINKEK